MQGKGGGGGGGKSKQFHLPNFYLKVIVNGEQSKNFMWVSMDPPLVNRQLPDQCLHEELATLIPKGFIFGCCPMVMLMEVNNYIRVFHVNKLLYPFINLCLCEVTGC